MPKIYIAYRHDDTAAAVKKIYDRLESLYGGESMLNGLGSKLPDAASREFISNQFAECDIVLVVIGSQWLSMLQKMDGDPKDLVRAELETALTAELTILPIYIGHQAGGLKEADLPENLSQLSSLKGTGIDLGNDFNADMDRLKRSIDAAIDSGPPLVRCSVQSDCDSGADRVEKDVESSLNQFEGMLNEIHERELDLYHKLEAQENSGEFGDTVVEIEPENQSVSDGQQDPEAEKDDTPGALDAAGDIQLEFNIDEEINGDQEEQAIDAEPAAPAPTNTADFMQDEEDFKVEDTVVFESTQTTPKVTKAASSNKSLVLIPLIIVLAVMAVLGGWWFLANDLRKTEANDPDGIIKLTATDISARFIENEKDGQLFVINGFVRNGYATARKKIRLRAKLFATGKEHVKTEHVIAGLVLTDEELARLSLAQTKDRLNVPAGQIEAMAVGPGDAVPFMVVFSDLPQKLEEFIVELVSSEKGT